MGSSSLLSVKLATLVPYLIVEGVQTSFSSTQQVLYEVLFYRGIYNLSGQKTDGQPDIAVRLPIFFFYFCAVDVISFTEKLLPEFQYKCYPFDDKFFMLQVY